VPSFPIRRSRWALAFLLPLGARHPTASVGDDAVHVRMGLHGSADIPLASIERLGTMRWPWWGGVGARIARGMVAFVGSSGTLVVLDLSRPRAVRAPLTWTVRRIAVGVEDPEAFMAAIATARGTAQGAAGSGG